MKEYYFLYKVENLENGKYYLGVHSSEDPGGNDNYLGSGTMLKKAIKKHGKQAFRKTILEQFDTKEQMYQREKEVVNLNVVLDPMSYNMQLGGMGGTRGAVFMHRGTDLIRVLPEYEKALTLQGWTRGNNKNVETRKNNGKPWHTEESKLKIGQANSIALKGKVQSEETRKKRAEARKGKCYLTEEGKERIRQAHLGQTISEETKEKIRKTKEANGTLYLSRREDVRAKNSAWHKDKVSNTKGLIWISKGEEQPKLIRPELLPSYLIEGWVRGRKWRTL